MQVMKFSLLCLSVLVVTAGASQAGMISGVTATSSGGTFSSYSLANLTNGAGLTPSISETATHSNSYPTMWLNNGSGTAGNLTFNLGGTFILSDVAIWQYNYPNITRGVKDFTLASSTDGVIFTPLLGTMTLAIGSNSSSEAAQLFALGGIAASHIRLHYLNNYGDTVYTGLSEVQFVESATVPEPGSIVAMLSLVACAGGVVVFRRRTTKCAP